MPTLRRLSAFENVRVSGIVARRALATFHSSLERSPKMRAGEHEHVAHPGHPPLAGGLVARAARNQAAHRVADQGDLVDLYRPIPVELAEQPREITSVGADAATAVVADVDRRVAKVFLERGSVWTMPIGV